MHISTCANSFAYKLLFHPPWIFVFFLSETRVRGQKPLMNKCIGLFTCSLSLSLLDLLLHTHTQKVRYCISSSSSSKKKRREDRNKFLSRILLLYQEIWLRSGAIIVEKLHLDQRANDLRRGGGPPTRHALCGIYI